MYFDDFESRRFSYIGTLPDPGVDDIQPTTQAGWQETLYNYTGTQPHAVTSLSVDQTSAGTYEYDANGNMTCRVESGLTYRQNYNAENRISSIARINGLCSNQAAEIVEVWAFAYDGDGTRVSTAHFTGLNPTPDSFSAYFMGGAYEITDGAVRKYYSFAGQTIAMRDSAGLKYFLTDHLGSVAAIMTPNQSGGWDTTQQRYLPFGEVRTDIGSISQTDFGYTSQRKLDDGMGGLMDYKARFYSPALGRFIQPDSIIPGAANPQSWNRYSYVINNPLRYTDPTGHDADCGGMAALADSYCNEAKREYYSWRQSHDTSFKTFLRAKDAYGFYYNHPEKAKKDQYAGNGKAVSSWEEVDPYTLASIYSEDVKHQFFNPISDQFIVWEMDEMNASREAGGYVDPKEWIINAFSLYVMWGPDGGSGGGSGDIKLSGSDLRKLEKRILADGYQSIEDLKIPGGKGAGRYDLYVKPNGDIVIKPSSGIGPGEPTGYNIYDLNP